MNRLLEQPAFVIHLQRCTERKPVFMKNITNAGFKDIRIFNGVDGSIIENIRDAKLKLEKNIIFDPEVSFGAIGCALSHFLVLKHIIDNNIQFATIFEDDVWFHPDWDTLSVEYYNETPNDWDIIFIGNGLDSCRNVNIITPKITTESCWCTHAYMITLEGCKKLLNSLINWDYRNFDHCTRGKTISGLYAIDIMIKDIQNNIISKKCSQLFNWYSWDGTKYPYKLNLLPVVGNDARNTGLVFQLADVFPSTVGYNIVFDEFLDENFNKIDTTTYETTEQWIAETFIPENAIVLELGGRYGVVSAKINMKLKNKRNHLVVEPDPNIYKCLVGNLMKNRSLCMTFNGIISKSPQYFHQAGIGSKTRCIPCSSESFIVEHKTLYEIINMSGLNFDTLVADCEGCLEQFFDDHLDYIKNFKLITFEEDYNTECNYEKVKKILADNSFYCIRPGAHSVWVRDSRVHPKHSSKNKQSFVWNKSFKNVNNLYKIMLNDHIAR